MTTDRDTQGWETIKLVHGDRGERVLQKLSEVSPELTQFIAEFAYGDIYSRPGLDPKTRQIIIVSALAAMGNAELELKSHLHAALNMGCTREEITELILQLTVYAGFPAALNAMMIAKEVFQERDRLA